MLVAQDHRSRRRHLIDFGGDLLQVQPINVVVFIVQRLRQLQRKYRHQSKDRPKGPIRGIQPRADRIQSSRPEYREERKREKIVTLERGMSARNINSQRERQPTAKIKL